MSDKMKIVGATSAARKKLEGGYKPFEKKKKTGCTSLGCNTAKAGTADNAQGAGKKE